MDVMGELTEHPSFYRDDSQYQNGSHLFRTEEIQSVQFPKESC